MPTAQKKLSPYEQLLQKLSPSTFQTSQNAMAQMGLSPEADQNQEQLTEAQKLARKKKLMGAADTDQSGMMGSVMKYLFPNGLR